ncbi:g7717 [Coccomyxa viridis]|uniref:G7717 protein n=1 Tax=Coccomyxa viridis TaxID=1274662 RepID=A0ABP1FYJ7_9CHLO
MYYCVWRHGGLGLAATGRQDLSCLIILIVLFTGLLAATGVSGLHIEGAVQDDDLMPERRTAERMHIVLSLYRESPAEVAHFVSQAEKLRHTCGIFSRTTRSYQTTYSLPRACRNTMTLSTL